MGKKILLIVILAIGLFLRFYGLMWGAPLFFHPDERNMAIAIAQLAPPAFNPHFFAYGQFPLYLAYFSHQFTQLHFFNFQTVPFESAIFWLRFYSAFSNFLIIPVFYLLSKRFFSIIVSRIATATLAFLPGLIQAAHFGTTESLLAFFFLLIIYLSLGLIEKVPLRRIVAISAILGMAIATKLNGLIFISAPLFALSLNFFRRGGPACPPEEYVIASEAKQSPSLMQFLKSFVTFTFTVSFLFTLSLLFSIIFSPHNLINFKEFISSINYESSVANGSVQVFYTRQFIDTIPIVFQFDKIFPYTLGFVITLIFPLGILAAFKKRDKAIFVAVIPFLIYFFFNAFLFAKWTRFLTPIFPLAVFFAFYFVSQIKGKRIVALLVMMLTIVLGLSFFSIYVKPDSRVSSSLWIYDNLPDKTNVLSETANVIDIPVNDLDHLQKSFNVTSFNFYEMDQNQAIFEELLDKLVNSEYIFIPSRRIFMNHTRLSYTYPKTTRYYQALFDGSLGFTQVAEINSFPSIGPIRFNDEEAEETFTVFDHPVIRIYKKVDTYSRADYSRLLNQKL